MKLNKMNATYVNYVQNCVQTLNVVHGGRTEMGESLKLNAKIGYYDPITEMSTVFIINWPFCVECAMLHSWPRYNLIPHLKALE